MSHLCVELCKGKFPTTAVAGLPTTVAVAELSNASSYKRPDMITNGTMLYGRNEYIGKVTTS